MVIKDIQESSDKMIETTKVLKDIKNLPSIPKVMFEVTNILRNNSTSTYELINAISKDQGLTTKILAVANSPFYGLQRRVSSLEFAIMVLGNDEIRSIVTAISLSNAIKIDSSENFNYDEFWYHSLVVASASKEIARYLGHLEIATDAFIGGMLHELGLQVMYKFFPAEFNEIAEKSKADGKFLENELEVLGMTHEMMGTFLSEKWGLPDDLGDAIGNHHQPTKAKTIKLIPAIVHLADYMTQKFGVAKFYWDDNYQLDEEIFSVLEFGSKEELKEFIKNHEEVFLEAASESAY